MSLAVTYLLAELKMRLAHFVRYFHDCDYKISATTVLCLCHGIITLMSHAGFAILNLSRNEMSALVRHLTLEQKSNIKTHCVYYYYIEL